jgi:tRNA-dihydrouridine synthase B
VPPRPSAELLLRPLALGAGAVAHRVWLAPMAGYTDAPFRQMCAEQGAALCFAEMASAEGIHRGSGRTLALLDRFAGEQSLGAQIFAADPRRAASAARAVAARSPRIIDLNCGCSVPKVLKGGCGAALLRSPGLVGAIVRAMRGETDLPVSVKLRLGWDEDSITFMDCAAEAVAAGAALVTLHPRTRAQGFRGRARWEEIGRLKAAASVPVFGSGDLLAAEDCLAMAEATGVDGVMIARGAIGNPFVFAETLALARGERQLFGPAERLGAALRHLELAAARSGEPVACREMRKHFVAYSKGLEGGAAFRQEIVHATTVARYRQLVDGFLATLAGP